MNNNVHTEIIKKLGILFKLPASHPEETAKLIDKFIKELEENNNEKSED